MLDLKNDSTPTKKPVFCVKWIYIFWDYFSPSIFLRLGVAGENLRPGDEVRLMRWIATDSFEMPAYGVLQLLGDNSNVRLAEKLFSLIFCKIHPGLERSCRSWWIFSLVEINKGLEVLGLYVDWIIVLCPWGWKRMLAISGEWTVTSSTTWISSSWLFLWWSFDDFLVLFFDSWTILKSIK